MNPHYEQLADYLSDHLWQKNSLDYDFLKLFPEFTYRGKGYRVHFLKEYVDPGSCINKSFAKTEEGLKEFIYNAQNYDKDFTQGKTPFVYECEIEGFDVSLALKFFKNNGGLTAKTVEAFVNEEEVIAFSHSPLRKTVV